MDITRPRGGSTSCWAAGRSLDPVSSDWRRPLDESLRDAYLARLGWDSPPRPSLETLRALHRAQVERVPYEVVWIALGESRTIDPIDSVRHVVADRGGYCYHLNGAFGALLDWLGFEVLWHAGGVQRHGQEPRGASGNHLALEVRALPTGESPAGAWYVDVGLGDGLHEPLPLVAGAYRQTPYTLSLRPSEVVGGGWRLDHDPRGSFAGLDFAGGDASLAALTSRHRELSASPDSGFVRTVTLARRDGLGADILRGRLLNRLDAGGELSTELATGADWFAAVADVFDLPLPDVDRRRRAALWGRLTRDHERFLAERDSSPS